MAISIHLSIITLNVCRLNLPIKRHKVAEWIKKKPRPIYTKDSLQKKGHTQTESEGMEKR